ncbi:MAG: WYL domain-containing protein [Treponema sp.]|nr:WYL domain-containing protein [Treponema sp.]
MKSKKKSKNEVRLDTRLMNSLKYIHTEIASGHYPNRKTLAKHLKCSTQTIWRYLVILEDSADFGGKIEYNHFMGGYEYTSKTEKGMPLFEPLGNSEMQILSAAKLLLSHFKNTPLYKTAEEILNQFCASAKREDGDDLLLSRIALAPNPYPMKDIASDKWNVVTDALKKNMVIMFKYRNAEPISGKEILSLKKVQPYQLVLDKGVCYLFGYDEQKKDTRLYDLSKMEDIRSTGQKFTLPKDYEFEKFTGGGHFCAFKRFHPKKYKIAFYEDARPVVRRGKWADDQVIEEDEKNDRTIITFTSSQDMKVADWVFENAAYALPLEPPSLVLRWKYNVGVMAKMAGYKVKVDVDISEVERMEREE